MNRAWNTFMRGIHGCVSVGLFSVSLPIHPLVFVGTLIAVGLYPMGWCAPPARHDALYWLASLIEQIALVGFAVSLALIAHPWAMGLLAVGMSGRVVANARRRPSSSSQQA